MGLSCTDAVQGDITQKIKNNSLYAKPYYSEENKICCKIILELNFKRNKEAKINFVLLSIIPLSKEILSKKDANYTAILLIYYHDKGLNCSTHGRNN
jgi:predicted nucleic-acid-binding protein